jgi:hypothetical protein
MSVCQKENCEKDCAALRAEVERLRYEERIQRERAVYQRDRAERAEAALEDRAAEHTRALSAWREERLRAIKAEAALRGLLAAVDAVRKDLGTQYPALAEASVLARAALREEGE